MSRLMNVGIVLLLLTGNIVTNAAPASSVPVLVVSGTIKDDKGISLGAGLSVQVANEERQLTATTTTDAAGKYIVMLAVVDAGKELIAAEVGETVSVKVQDATGKQLGSESHELTDEDIRAANVSIDVLIPAEGPPSKNPPTVTINSTYKTWESGELEIKAEATDTDGTIRDVLFQYSLDDQTWHDIGRDATPPYAVNWDTTPVIETMDDSVWVKAIATDNDDLTGEYVIDRSFGVDNRPPAATLSISTPIADQILPAGTTFTTLTVSIANHTGPWHWKLNEAFPTSGAAGGNQVASGNTDSITSLQDGQAYTVYVALADANSSLLSPSVTTNVAFSVAAPSPEPYFVVSALKTEVTAKAGGFATYLIKLEGRNGFEGDLTLGLFVSKLPPSEEARFDPEVVTLSAEEPFVTSQLTLTIPMEPVPGDYPFVVLAIPESGETKQLTLMLKIEFVAPAATTLTLILQPTELPFMGKLNLLGQLASLSETPVELGDTAIQIILTSPGGKTYTFEAKTDAEGIYQLATPFSPDEVGEWSVKAQFAGNAQLKPSERSSSFSVTKGHAEIIFDTGRTGALGTEIIVVGHLEPSLEGELLSLKILRPDGSASTLTGISTETLGVFRHTLKLDIGGDWEITATWPGNDEYEGVEQKLLILVSEEMGKAIIVLGGGGRRDNSEWIRFNRVVEYVHRVLLRRNFDDEEDIYFLSPDPVVTKGADNVTSAAALEFAITDWAAEQVNELVPLYLYLLSHNLGDQFLLEQQGNQKTYLTPAQLDEWLDRLPEGTPVTVITEACYSGNFIRTSGDQPTALVDPNRTIIVSARGDKQAKIHSNGSSFSKWFFERIGANKTIGEAFNDAERLMERLPSHRDQFPLMDADGDGRVNTTQDYLAADRYIPADLISLAEPPSIIDITSPQTLPEGVSSLNISVELLGVNITSVSATVIPPDFDPTQEISDWSELEFPELDLAVISGEDNRYEYAATYTNFTIPGDYTVIVDAENPDGSADPVQTTITVPGAAAVKKGDVNNDGRIRSNDAILTLRIAAGLMTPTEYEEQAADVNGDGRIGSNDAILILRVAAGLAAL